MKPAHRRWELPSTTSPIAGIDPVLGAVLASRGLNAAEADALLFGVEDHHDPVGLAGMCEAVIAVGVAVHSGHRIAVYGDYDADGVTACAMLTLALRAAGADVLPYIPNRMAEGYGLHAPALRYLAEQGVRLVITVDCGTSSVDVAATRPEGQALVITDHHLAPAPGGGAVRLPDVDALVNPKRPDCTYAFDALAGAGVAWKLLEALEAEGVVPRGSADASVALAALGTVADMMPLRGENRTLVRRGLALMADAPSPGLRALMEVSQVRDAPRASDLAFTMAPRINAAGRMEDAELALRLCLAPTLDDARPIAQQLDEQNRERKAAVATALADADRRVSELPDDLPAIVIGDPGWPMGIVGLVAGRLAERYARPAFVACLDGEEGKGSARSVHGVHLVHALDLASAPLLRYGGHAAAAGFSVDPARFDEFAQLVTAAVSEQLGNAAREKVWRVDAVVEVADVSPRLCAALAALEPCGQGNREPLLAVQGSKVLATGTFGAERQHVRVWLGDAAGGSPVEAIAFNKPGLADHLPIGRRIDACFGLELDRWDGEERVRLLLRDLQPHRAAQVTAQPSVIDARVTTSIAR
jgi:single-stranded-DNA-specific exonuclease